MPGPRRVLPPPMLGRVLCVGLILATSASSPNVISSVRIDPPWSPHETRTAIVEPDWRRDTEETYRAAVKAYRLNRERWSRLILERQGADDVAGIRPADGGGGS